MTDGNRKSAKIRALQRINDKHKLGMTLAEMEALSVSQLRRLLLSLRRKYGIPIHKLTKIPKDMKIENIRAG